MKFLILALVSMASVCFAATSSPFTVVTPRGVKIQGFLHLPNGSAKAPLVIIGSGSGYHMNYPLTQGLAEKLANGGIAAIRFNWGFFGTGGSYSADFKDEIQDYESVMHFALAQPRVDPKRIIAAGKSLGSMVAYRVFARHVALRAAILLTPVCTEYEDPSGKPLPTPVSSMQVNYPYLFLSTRPVVIVGGTNDPACKTPMLYMTLSSSRGQIAPLLFGGDHSMNIVPADAPNAAPINKLNTDAASNAIVHWVRLLNN